MDWKCPAATGYAYKVSSIIADCNWLKSDN